MTKMLGTLTIIVVPGHELFYLVNPNSKRQERSNRHVDSFSRICSFLSDRAQFHHMVSAQGLAHTKWCGLFSPIGALISRNIHYMHKLHKLPMRASTSFLLVDVARSLE
jgi:hypothetical protein